MSVPAKRQRCVDSVRGNVCYFCAEIVPSSGKHPMKAHFSQSAEKETKNQLVHRELESGIDVQRNVKLYVRRSAEFHSWGLTLLNCYTNGSDEEQFGPTLYFLRGHFAEKHTANARGMSTQCFRDLCDEFEDFKRIFEPGSGGSGVTDIDRIWNYCKSQIPKLFFRQFFRTLPLCLWGNFPGRRHYEYLIAEAPWNIDSVFYGFTTNAVRIQYSLHTCIADAYVDALTSKLQRSLNTSDRERVDDDAWSIDDNLLDQVITKELADIHILSHKPKPGHTAGAHRPPWPYALLNLELCSWTSTQDETGRQLSARIYSFAGGRPKEKKEQEEDATPEVLSEEWFSQVGDIMQSLVDFEFQVDDTGRQLRSRIGLVDNFLEYLWGLEGLWDKPQFAGRTIQTSREHAPQFNLRGHIIAPNDTPFTLCLQRIAAFSPFESQFSTEMRNCIQSWEWIEEYMKHKDRHPYQGLLVVDMSKIHYIENIKTDVWVDGTDFDWWETGIHETREPRFKFKPEELMPLETLHVIDTMNAFLDLYSPPVEKPPWKSKANLLRLLNESPLLRQQVEEQTPETLEEDWREYRMEQWRSAGKLTPELRKKLLEALDELRYCPTTSKKIAETRKRLLAS